MFDHVSGSDTEAPSEDDVLIDSGACHYSATAALAAEMGDESESEVSVQDADAMRCEPCGPVNLRSIHFSDCPEVKKHAVPTEMRKIRPK